MSKLLLIFGLVLLSTLGLAAQTKTPLPPDALAIVHGKVVQELVWYGVTLAIITGFFGILKSLIFEKKRKVRKKYYNEDYLQSDVWKRKRAMVLKRDNWRCGYCNSKATDVHHKRYARQIGKEPIDWLVSVCPRCHEIEHPEKQPIQSG